MKNAAPKIEIPFYKELHVNRCSFSTLVELFNPGTMTPQGIAMHRDSLQIRIYGYEADQQLPFMIPEVRAFVRTVRQNWPYAPFFCDLDGPYVSCEVFSSFDQLTVVDREDCDQICFKIPTLDLRRYVRESRQTIRDLGTRSKMKPFEIKARIERLEDYLRRSCGPW